MGGWGVGRPGARRGRAFPARCRRGSLPLSPSPLRGGRRRARLSRRLPRGAPGKPPRAEKPTASPRRDRAPPAGRPLPGAHRERGAGGGGRRPGGGAALPAGYGATLPADLGGGLGSVTPTSGSAD